MRPDELYNSHKQDWQQLTQLLDYSQNNIQRLSPEEVQIVGKLYRGATSDLALAQRDFPRHQVALYLNQLVARAHAVIYRSEPLATRRIIRYITTGFPRAYRQAGWFILTAMFFLMLPAVTAGLTTAWNPDAARWLLPAQVQDLIPSLREHDLWTNIPIEQRPFASSFIMRNNIQVAFLSFASGIIGGLFTAWILASNGLMLGGVLGLAAHYRVGFELSTFIIGHGVIELSVIFIAGGTGLMLGWALISPGLFRRRDALVLAARQAVNLVIGCVPLLLIAGSIEGFISPSEAIPPGVKWGVGIFSGVLLYAYLLLAGREAAHPQK